MRCKNCKNECSYSATESKIYTRLHPTKRFVLFENVPVARCLNCTTSTYGEKMLLWLDRKAKIIFEENPDTDLCYVTLDHIQKVVHLSSKTVEQVIAESEAIIQEAHQTQEAL